MRRRYRPTITLMKGSCVPVDVILETALPVQDGMKAASDEAHKYLLGCKLGDDVAEIRIVIKRVRP